MRIATIIVTYNNRDTIERAVESVLMGMNAGDDVIVIDNSSSDGTAAFLRRRFAAARVSVYDRPNLGYGAGINFGRKCTEAEQLLILNPDAYLHPGGLSGLRALTAADVVYAPKQFGTGGYYTGAGYAVDLFGFHVPLEHSSKVFFAGGSGMYCSAQLFDTLGGFDERGFLFGEDVDFSWRAWLRGYRVESTDAATVIHEHGHSITGGRVETGVRRQTSVWRRYLSERNAMRNAIRNYAMSTLGFVMPAGFVLLAAEIAFLLMRRQWRAAAADVRAMVDVAREMPTLLRERREIQASRIVGDREILSKIYFGSGKLLLLLSEGTPKFVD